jgi:hypothetical protein
MAEHRKGHKINPQTGLTKPEERARLTRKEAEAQADDGKPAPSRARRLRPPRPSAEGRGGSWARPWAASSCC